MSQAKALAEKIDNQTEITTEAEQTWSRYRDELAEVYFRLQKLPPKKPLWLESPSLSGLSAICETRPHRRPHRHCCLGGGHPTEGMGVEMWKWEESGGPISGGPALAATNPHPPTPRCRQGGGAAGGGGRPQPCSEAVVRDLRARLDVGGGLPPQQMQPQSAGAPAPGQPNVWRYFGVSVERPPVREELANMSLF